jgi:WD40 repeat protein
VRVWSLEHGEVLYEVDADRLRVRALAFSPDSQQLATGGDGRLIHVFDTRDGAVVSVLQGPPAKTLALVYGGERMLISGASDNLIRVWEIGSQSEVLRLLGHTGSVTSLAFHVQTGLLASGSFDTTVRLWNLAGDGRGNFVRQARKK